MAAAEGWWLYRNSLQPTGGNVFNHVPPVMGDRHMDNVPAADQSSDEAKAEMFNGGRRVLQRRPPLNISAFASSAVWSASGTLSVWRPPNTGGTWLQTVPPDCGRE